VSLNPGFALPLGGVKASVPFHNLRRRRLIDRVLADFDHLLDKSTDD
jgi:hypothetical protein